MCLVKTAALLLIAAVDAALYLCPPPQAPSAPVKTVAAAPRREAARTYFHSSLSAPAMSTSEHTGFGYFSTNPSPDYQGERSTAASTTPVTATGASQGGLSWSEPSEAADIGALQKVYTLPKIGQARPTISQ